MNHQDSPFSNTTFSKYSSSNMPRRRHRNGVDTQGFKKRERPGMLLLSTNQLQLTLKHGVNAAVVFEELRKRPIEVLITNTESDRVRIQLNMPQGIYFNLLRSDDLDQRQSFVDLQDTSYGNLSLTRHQGQAFRLWLGSDGEIGDIEDLRSRPIVITYGGNRVVCIHATSVWQIVRNEIDNRVTSSQYVSRSGMYGGSGLRNTDNIDRVQLLESALQEIIDLDKDGMYSQIAKAALKYT